MRKRDITNEELFVELVWDKLQTHEYIVIDGNVIDPEDGELICQLQILGLDES